MLEQQDRENTNSKDKETNEDENPLGVLNDQYRVHNRQCGAIQDLNLIFLCSMIFLMDWLNSAEEISEFKVVLEDKRVSLVPKRFRGWA